MSKVLASSKGRSWNLRSNAMAFLLGASFSFAVLSKYSKGSCSEIVETIVKTESKSSETIPESIKKRRQRKKLSQNWTKTFHG
jgi:hypothetical protein